MPVLNDVELEQKWVNALRSGEYKQTQKVLHNNSGFCCLGVLCEVMKLSSRQMSPGGNFTYIFGVAKEDDWVDEDGVEGSGEEYEDTDDGELSQPFRRRIGMNGNHANKLMEMNDKDNKSFAEIADWIEEQRNVSNTTVG